ncbi:MAG: prealbumin-like fold domain-containing protein [Firmicutes bacterium]|nr:prealbumin-like fold domain-containing protein [Bacillota bacterium]
MNAFWTILNNAYASGAAKVSSDIAIQPEDTKWNVDSINPQYVSMTYAAVSAAPMDTYTINITGTLPEGAFAADVDNNPKTTFNSGEKFKILIPIQNLKTNGDFDINVSGMVDTKPVLYGEAPNGGLQDYALTAAVYEDGSGSLKSYYTENSTGITILKQEGDTEKPLPGVEFELLDKDQNVIYTSLVTNEQGEASVNNLMPGTYYVKEVKTLEGYTLYSKLIEVKLELNENSKVIVNNSKEEVKEEISKPAENVQEVEAKSSVQTVTQVVESKPAPQPAPQTVVLPKTGC